MPVYIHHIETGVPETVYSQDYIRDFMKEHVSDKELTNRIIHRIYSQSGIQQRHTVIKDFKNDTPLPDFFESINGTLSMPSTKHRNDLYIREAKKLYPGIARKTIDHCHDIDYRDITHVITVSCTGFFAPGPDYFIVKELKLSPNTHRYHLGFMGCYATFPALKMAKSICESDSSANVLVVSLELCTLHLQFREEPDFLISASLFADGGGGMIVSSRMPRNPATALEMKHFTTNVTPTGEEDMAWTIGNNGFDMILSTYVPKIIGENINNIIQPLFKNNGMNKDMIDYWAIHPGGRAIIDNIQKSLGLTDEHTRYSREVLKTYGNMSSATIIFVLKQILEQPSPKENEQIYAMAFGPGLTIESGLLIKNPLLD
ncbi:MAG TPA: type III polyketide synthase [Balneolales bacterium]|nr:type III polyketide synthase [Balneolales bacterium]